MSANPLRLPLHGERAVVAEGAVPGTFEVLLNGEAVGGGAISLEGQAMRIQRLCIEPEKRGYGAGSEAARLLIDAAARSGAHRVRAHAPPGAGLAVYFWVRMGLRPLHGEGPGGGIWFEAKLRC